MVAYAVENALIPYAVFLIITLIPADSSIMHGW